MLQSREFLLRGENFRKYPVFKSTESDQALDNNELVTERRLSPLMLAIWPVATSSCLFRIDPPPEDLQKIRPKDRCKGQG
jgi:hypothetical protein